VVIRNRNGYQGGFLEFITAILNKSKNLKWQFLSNSNTPATLINMHMSKTLLGQKKKK
jgi:hypothetical protein